jgi:predicted RNA binding protein with dsRBD fold (UPF0201 family)
LEANLDLAITLRASVSPSEDPEKVLEAARNVLGECTYQVEEDTSGFTLRSTEKSCLQRVHDQLRDRHVRAAANRLLLRMSDDRRVTVLLNRQAAAVGIIALCASPDESALGPLVMQIESRRPESVIEWLTAY